MSSGGSRGESIPCIFQFLEDVHIPWLVVSSPSSKAAMEGWLQGITQRILSPSITYKDLCNYITYIQIIKDNLTISSSLTKSQVHSHFCHKNWHTHRSQGLVYGHLAGDIVLPPTSSKFIFTELIYNASKIFSRY